VRLQQDYYNRLISSADGPVWVRLRPRGSTLRDLTRGVEIVHWFSMIPGVLSIVGWILHHTAFRSQWLVTVEPAPPVDNAPPVQVASLRKRVAERVFLRLDDWLRDGHALAEFSAAG
jgi:hypothetical protein